MSAKPEIDPLTGTPLSGHSWDGITELETRPPRWWVLTYAVCILYAIGYWVVYPAWPTLSGYTEGMFGWSSRRDVEQQLAAAEQAQGALNARLKAATVEEIRQDPELLRFAVAGGRTAFRDNCAACHGSGAQGQPGYPNLLDDDWLWGGSLAEIQKTLQVGIRSIHPETRMAEMPAFGRDGLLTRAQIEQLADYVLSLSGTPAAPQAIAAGAAMFADNCAACHGEKAEGNRELGAPRLSDGLWLYGGDRASLITSIHSSRKGVMPAWQGRLSEETIKKLTVYVHTLGGGE